MGKKGNSKAQMPSEGGFIWMWIKWGQACLSSHLHSSGAGQKQPARERASTQEIQAPSGQFQAKLLGSLLLQSRPASLWCQGYCWGPLPTTYSQCFKEKKNPVMNIFQNKILAQYDCYKYSKENLVVIMRFTKNNSHQNCFISFLDKVAM